MKRYSRADKDGVNKPFTLSKRVRLDQAPLADFIFDLTARLPSRATSGA